MRCRMEHEVQELEQRTSALRASYLLNQEKLLYTHHVLTQRDAETRTLIPHLKHQLIEQGRVLAELKVRPHVLACAGSCHVSTHGHACT